MSYFAWMARVKDIRIGRKFGLWTVISEKYYDRPRKHNPLVMVRCVCGLEKEVFVHTLGTAEEGGVSAGCRKCRAEKGADRHHWNGGIAKHPLRVIWTGIIDRCQNPRSKYFYRYGGRGIYVCERWRDDFWNFVADMGARPSAMHTVDRIDNDGPYSPDNCRWATPKEQYLNRSPGMFPQQRGEHGRYVRVDH